MTPEQKQRIQQIEARQNLRSGRVMLAAEGVLHDDVDFLLSLVKSQEADDGETLRDARYATQGYRQGFSDAANQAAVTHRPTGWISCGLRHGHDRIVDIVFENATCAKEFIDGVEPVTGPIIAADQMRSACVEKVRAMISVGDGRGWDDGYGQVWRQACTEIITALESLSIENP